MAKAKRGEKEVLCKRWDTYWVLKNSDSTYPSDHLRMRCLTFGSRVEAIIAVYEDEIDPFTAALGFPHFYLIRVSHKNPRRGRDGHSGYAYRNSYSIKRYSLTNAEKAFLARRVANSIK